MKRCRIRSKDGFLQAINNKARLVARLGDISRQAPALSPVGDGCAIAQVRSGRCRSHGQVTSLDQQISHLRRDRLLDGHA